MPKKRKRETAGKPYFAMEGLRVFCGDFLALAGIQRESVDLTVTSPPYSIDVKYGRYNDSIPYSEYLQFTRSWLEKCFSLTKPDGRLCLNIPLDKNKGGQQSVYADIENVAREVGWKYHTTIVWNEQNISRRTAWGSWKSASAPFVISPVEMILVMYKGDAWKKTSGSGVSDITRDEFLNWTNGFWEFGSDRDPEFNPIWSFNGESKKKAGHPAPFPYELPKRCVKLFSFVGDMILDPFVGCYDSETEVLTDEGFRYFSEVTDETMVATKNLQSMKLEYQKPLGRQRYWWDGSLLHFTGKHVDLLVTPDHSVLSRDRYRKQSGFVLRPAIDVSQQDEIDREVCWDGTPSQFFKLDGYESFVPAHIQQRHGMIVLRQSYTRAKRQAMEIPMNEWLEFLGLYLAEGSLTDKGIKITQIVKRAEVEEILARLPFHVTPIGNKDYFIHEKRLTKYLSPLGNKYTKYIPREFLDLPPFQLEHLLYGLVLGDGHRFEDGSCRYYSVNEEIINQVAEIALKLGYGVTVGQRAPRTNYLRGHFIQGKTQYELYMSRKHNTPKIRSISREDYHGFVWCVTVPNQTLVVRRGGRVMICGNSGTTLVAARENNRVGVGVEIDEDYCLLAKERLGRVRDVEEEGERAADGT